jgi:hypothetical protein
MIQLDIQTLNDRLFDNMDVEDIQMLLQNDVARDVDDGKLWSRWIVLPGIETRRTAGRTYVVQRDGNATLQVFVPRGQLTAVGWDVVEQFNDVFRSWTSEDGRLTINNLKSTTSTYKEGDAEFFLINATISWTSKRLGLAAQ